jgi:hypothetical protein
MRECEYQSCSSQVQQSSAVPQIRLDFLSDAEALVPLTSTATPVSPPTHVLLLPRFEYIGNLTHKYTAITANSPNCCSGQFDTPETCPPSGVAFYSYFKDNCPNAYAYAFDEGSNTALWTCDSGLAADYTLTFCP